MTGLLFSVLFYFSSYYPQFVYKKLTKSVFNNLEASLKESYLYDSSNLSRLNVRFGGEINIKLKRKSIYNPRDSKALFEEFTEKYIETVDTLPMVFYPLRSLDIKFYIDESEKSGAVFVYSEGKKTEKYSNVREQIITGEQKIAKEKKQQEEEKRLAEKHKELSGKAFGFANFGDSIKDVRIKFEEDPRVRINDVMVDNPIYEVVLGSFRYKMTPIYKNGKLYMMNFVSEGYWPNQYKKEFKRTWKDIVDFYSKIYGKVEVNFPELEELEEEYIEWTAEWKLHKKKIQVGLSRNKGLFYVVIWISHDDYKIN